MDKAGGRAGAHPIGQRMLIERAAEMCKSVVRQNVLRGSVSAATLQITLRATRVRQRDAGQWNTAIVSDITFGLIRGRARQLF